MTDLIYFLTFALLVWFILRDEDDDEGGGKMIPAYQRTER